MRTRVSLLVVSLLCLLLATPAFAGKPKTDNAPDAAVTTVSGVDAVNNQVTLTVKDGNVITVYDLPPGTTITIDGNPAVLSQIHSGMLVNSFTESDSHTLSQLDVSSKEAPSDSSSGSGKKKKSSNSNSNSNNNNSDSNS